MTKVMAFGTFDIIHPGHIYYLKKAKKEGDVLIVVIARDLNVKKIKGSFPSYNEEQRFNKIKKLDITKNIIYGDLNDWFKVIRDIKPDVVCLGYDQDSAGLAKEFPDIKIVRIKPYKEHMYKSSKLK